MQDILSLIIDGPFFYFFEVDDSCSEVAARYILGMHFPRHWLDQCVHKQYPTK
jgi:hypothetical protein